MNADDDAWLRHSVIRMRALLRYAHEPLVENGLRELIADAEKRLEPLQQKPSSFRAAAKLERGMPN